MQTIDLLAGTTIDRAALALVQQAPARADFNGITIRARHATTKPRDIVARYTRLIAERGVIWRNSPEGKRVLAEQEAKRIAAQATVNVSMLSLGALKLAASEGMGIGEIAAVLAWVEGMAGPCDRVGVRVDKDRIRLVFESHGWERGANSGEAFDGEDARNFAGWIVGQWLDCFWPGVSRFIAQWRAEFLGVPS